MSVKPVKLVVLQPQNGSGTRSPLNTLDEFLDGRTSCMMKSVYVVFTNESSLVVRSKVSEEFQIGQNAFCIPNQSELRFRSRFCNQRGEIHVITIALNSVGDGMMFISLDDQ